MANTLDNEMVKGCREKSSIFVGEKQAIDD
jgi:hypothetical protein